MGVFGFLIKLGRKERGHPVGCEMGNRVEEGNESRARSHRLGLPIDLRRVRIARENHSRCERDGRKRLSFEA